MPVAERPEEPGFRTELLDLRDHAFLPALGELLGRGLAKELVRQRDLVVDPRIHHLHELVGRRPALRAQLGEPRVIPRDHGLVGRQLLQLPELAAVVAEPLVEALKVRVAARSLLARDRQAGIQLRQQGLVGLCVVEDIGVGDRALRLGGDVAGSDTSEHGEGTAQGHQVPDSGCHVVIRFSVCPRSSPCVRQKVTLRPPTNVRVRG